MEDLSLLQRDHASFILWEVEEVVVGGGGGAGLSRDVSAGLRGIHFRRFAKPTCPIRTDLFSRVWFALGAAQLQPDALICSL
jgi:hypothetical protein